MKNLFVQVQDLPLRQNAAACGDGQSRFSAKGSHYNKTEFYDAMCSGLGGRVPVLDVVSEFGCEAAE